MNFQITTTFKLLLLLSLASTIQACWPAFTPDFHRADVIRGHIKNGRCVVVDHESFFIRQGIKTAFCPRYFKNTHYNRLKLGLQKGDQLITEHYDDHMTHDILKNDYCEAVLVDNSFALQFFERDHEHRAWAEYYY